MKKSISLKRALSCAALLLMLMSMLLICGTFTASAADIAEVDTYAADTVAFAAEETAQEDAEAEKDDGISGKAIAAGLAIGLAAAAGAIGMGIAIAKSSEGIARQPEAEGKIRSNLMIGLVFIETAIIYSLIVSILIIFVL